MNQETIFILAVALITWGGVFFYLLRLGFLAREIETKISERDEMLRDEQFNVERADNAQAVPSESAP